MSAPRSIGRGCRLLKILSQSIQGLRLNPSAGQEDKLRELCHVMRNRHVDAILLQETRIPGGGTSSCSIDGSVFHLARHAGPTGNGVSGGNGFGGVAVLMTSQMHSMWDRSIRSYGERLMALRFRLRWGHCVTIGCGYAPHSQYPAADRSDFRSDLLDLEAATHHRDSLLIGADINCEPGNRFSPKLHPRAVGNFGSSAQNSGGVQFLSTLSAAELCLAPTFFQKRKNDTWHDNFNGRGKGRGHAIDSWIVRSRSMRYVSDCGSKSPLATTDHRSMQIVIRDRALPKPRTIKCRSFGDVRLLQRPETAAEYIAAFQKELSISKSSDTPYSRLVQAASKAKAEALPAKHLSQSWFECHKAAIVRAISARNVALGHYESVKTANAHAKFRRARANLKQVKLEAKSRWIESQVALADDTNARASWQAWQAIKDLRAGIGIPARATIPLMNKKDGSCSKSPSESATVFQQHFQDVFGHDSFFDKDAANSIPQRPIEEHMCDLPDDTDIEHHITKASANGAPGIDQVSARELQILWSVDGPPRSLLRDLVHNFWHTSEVEPEWLISKLTILYKGSGDAKDTNRYRAICLMQSAAKLVGSIITSRLIKLLQSQGLEEQNGFMPQRGTTDGIFVLKQALARRKEFGQETWVLLLDLVKAFDRVNREMLWILCSKFGVPDLIVRHIRALYEGSVLKCTIDGVKATIPSTTGVKQGDNLASALFLIVVQLALESLSWPDECDELWFFTAADGVVSHRSVDLSRAEVAFTLRQLLYADDCGVMFHSRRALSSGSNALISHLQKFSLQVHYAPLGRPPESSKTVAMHIPTGRPVDVEPDTQPLSITAFIIGERSFPAGSIPFTVSAKYLGATLSSDLTDDIEIQSRIAAAHGAFAKIRPILRHKLSTATKRSLYTMFVLPVLLHGSECWSLTAANLQTLRVFHHDCVRRICKVSRWWQWRHRVTTKRLLNMLEVPDLLAYIDQRTLRWLGHIARMGQHRLPKRLLFSWVIGKRRQGRPQKCFNTRATELLCDLVEHQGMIGSRQFSDGRLLRSARNAPEPPQLPVRYAYTERFARIMLWADRAQDRVEWKRHVATFLKVQHGFQPKPKNSRSKARVSRPYGDARDSAGYGDVILSPNR